MHCSTGPQKLSKVKVGAKSNAFVEELAQCYKALSDHAAQEISPEILLSPALHHDDQDQEKYDIQMIVNSEPYLIFVTVAADMSV